MEKDKVIGALLVLVCLVVAAFYTWGIFLAPEIIQVWLTRVTVYIAVLILMVLGIWIGYTLATTPSAEEIEKELGEIEEKTGEESEKNLKKEAK